MYEVKGIQETKNVIWNYFVVVFLLIAVKRLRLSDLK